MSEEEREEGEESGEQENKEVWLCACVCVCEKADIGGKCLEENQPEKKNKRTRKVMVCIE